MSEGATVDEKFELEYHLDVAARWAIRVAFESWAEDSPWEGSFPDVGQYDVDEIIESAEQLLPADVTLDEWQKTYDWFADRAEEDTSTYEKRWIELVDRCTRLTMKY